MLVRDVESHPAFKATISAATMANPWWLDYINQISPLVSFLALMAGAIYMCLQVAHLLKHWNTPKQ